MVNRKGLDSKRKLIDNYQKAVEAYSQAMSFFHKRDFAKAVEYFKKVIEKFSSEKEVIDRANLYLSICESYLEEEEPEIKSFEDYYQYGIYHLNLGNYEQAIELLQTASQKNPKEGKVYYALADTYCLMGDNQSALSYLKKAIQQDEFFKILAQNETDFEPLWKDKEFQKLVKENA
ncbi:MAG: tetratricopeptide repeat protein [Candidatus Aminicenantia bacterium]